TTRFSRIPRRSSEFLTQSKRAFAVVFGWSKVIELRMRDAERRDKSGEYRFGNAHRVRVMKKFPVYSYDALNPSATFVDSLRLDGQNLKVQITFLHLVHWRQIPFLVMAASQARVASLCACL